MVSWHVSVLPVFRTLLVSVHTVVLMLLLLVVAFKPWESIPAVVGSLSDFDCPAIVATAAAIVGFCSDFGVCPCLCLTAATQRWVRTDNCCVVHPSVSKNLDVAFKILGKQCSQRRHSDVLVQRPNPSGPIFLNFKKPRLVAYF